ncbi:MAG: UDP-2,3-diacylglucosamine diphosphatase [Marinilabiliales bacterium]|nr:UDP-2,3-diacylglucosamine diphosphatase [Marinilabiliales bacterium]
MIIEKKIYFISDLHFGAKALKDNREREMLFADWLRSIRKDAAMLFLMGDFFDFWFEYKKVVPKGFVRSLGVLADLCDQGIPVHFFTGNHDIWAFDYLSEEIGMQIHTDSETLELMGKKFFLSHGDDLGKKDFGYQLIKNFFHNKLAQWAFAKIHPDLSFRLAHHWSKKSRLSYKDGDKGFHGEEKEEQVVFAKQLLKKEHFDFIVFGHRHILLDLTLESDCRLIILGDWIRKFTYGVFDGKQFVLESISNEKLKEFRISI